MAKRKHTDDIIIFIILAIGVSIVAFIAFGRYSDNKDISSNTAQQVSGKVEENKEVSIESFKKKLIDNGLEITEETTKAGSMIGAKEKGYGYEINGKFIEIYQYDLNSIEELTKNNIKLAQTEGKITMPAFNNIEYKAVYNKGLVLINYEEHPNKDKILEIFNSL